MKFNNVFCITIYSGLVLLALSFLFVGCSSDRVTLPDHKAQIDLNTARILLLEVNDQLQDLRLDDLEFRVDGLETRMDQAEDDIDANEIDILALFDGLVNLGEELDSLRDELRDEVAALKRADRKTRRMIRRKVARLRAQLNREIRMRQLADHNLQNQLDSLERTVKRNIAKQRVINMFLARGLFMTNQRISQLQRHIARLVAQINHRLDSIEQEIASINAEIDALQNQLSDMQAELDAVADSVVSVVYPCGEDNSEEVLLQTQDGLVAYLQIMETKTLRFSDSVTIPGYTIPSHHDKYCADTAFFSGKCIDYDYRYVSGYNVPTATYHVGDTARIRVLKHAYLDVLDDGWYRTTDGYSCTFRIDDGQVVNGDDD